MSGQKIKVVSYRPEWALEFEHEKARLLEIMAPHAAAFAYPPHRWTL
ncbi:hypothetical protein [Paenibacillus sp. sptzw28]|nr:hypothetical protein [Paenibacillus sp. sptzw28]